jgi:hypothetical protein
MRQDDAKMILHDLFEELSWRGARALRRGDFRGRVIFDAAGRAIGIRIPTKYRDAVTIIANNRRWQRKRKRRSAAGAIAN